jgi:hypothetical protein
MTGVEILVSVLRGVGRRGPVLMDFLGELYSTFN